MSLVSLVQTIPSIALLAIMVALLGGHNRLLASFHCASCSYIASLPIIRNTIVGLESVDPAMREAAKAVGMRPASATSLLVELPLALTSDSRGYPYCHCVGGGHRYTFNTSWSAQSRQLYIQWSSITRLAESYFRVCCHNDPLARISISS
jgi:hypothetical protein